MKACIYCRFCQYDPPYRYSSWTSGGGDFSCARDKFRHEPEIGEGRLWEIAQDCDDFELTDEIQRRQAKKSAKISEGGAQL